MTSEELPPQKEKSSLSLSSQSLSLSSLPDDIIENILARISKWTYPNVSLVSKRFLSILSSSELYTMRSYLGTTEPCLYLCFKSPNHSSSQWYTLWMKPDEILTDDGDILNDFSLIPLHSSSQSHSPRLPYDSIVAVGLEIYVIGGIFQAPSSAVRILDCTSNTLRWRDGPDMKVARADPAAVLMDKKIYVMGGCEIDESDNWFEVFDIETQSWGVLPSHGADPELRSRYIKVNPNAFKGKLYVTTASKEYTYDTKAGAWKVVREESSLADIQNSCMVDNILCYWSFSGYLLWYDSKDREWRKIKGLRKLHEHDTRPLHSRAFIAIVNCSGKLVVMWSQWLDVKERRTWCAKIALEHHKDEIWGKIEWLNTVLIGPQLRFCSTLLAVSI